MAGATEAGPVAEVSADVDHISDRPAPSFSEENVDENKAASDQEASGSDAESEPPQEEEKEATAEASDGRDNLTRSEKRERKKVQRLSETWNRAHVEQVEQKAKIVKELISALETGSGTPLGDIPIIEAAFRKTKPVNLKVLHTMIYNRPGTAIEIRTNLRKFRGFGFSTGSEQFQKKVNQFQNRSTSELREALRLLSLEVSGSREQLIDRLMEFLLKPAAGLVKYKGKLPAKSSRGRSRSASKDKTKRKSRTHKKTSSKATSSEVSGDAASRSAADYDDERDSLSNASDSNPSEQSDDDDEEEQSPKPVPKKRGRPPGKSSKTTPAPKQGKKKRPGTAELTDSDSDLEEQTKPPVSKRSKPPAKASAESDEDAPLSTLASTKSNSAPSDAELKRSIIDLLKTVNLEETSLKLVREQIFSRYPGVDLTNKKEFINTTVKEYLARS